MERIKQLISALKEEQINGKLDEVEIADMQTLTEIVIKMYGRKLEVLYQKDFSAEPIMPVSKSSFLPQTETIMFIHGLLQAKNIELFELQMFKSF